MPAPIVRRRGFPLFGEGGWRKIGRLIYRNICLHFDNYVFFRIDKYIPKFPQIYFKLLQIQGWQQEANQNEKSGAAVIDSPRKFAWKLGSCRNYRPTINQRIMSQTRTRVVQTCQSFLDSFAGIFQSLARMGKTIFHAVQYNNGAGNTTSWIQVLCTMRSILYSCNARHTFNIVTKDTQ